MKLLVSGFLVGILGFFVFEGWWDDQLDMAVQETKKERDEFWKNYYSAKLSEERSDCLHLREQDRLDCEAQLKATLKEAYRQGEAAGKSKARYKYEDLLARKREVIHLLSRQRDSLRMEVKMVNLKVKSPIDESIPDPSGQASGLYLLSDREVGSVAKGNIRPGHPKLPLLSAYVLGMIFLILLITLLILRLLHHRKHRKLRL